MALSSDYTCLVTIAGDGYIQRTTGNWSYVSVEKTKATFTAFFTENGIKKTKVIAAEKIHWLLDKELFRECVPKENEAPKQTLSGAELQELFKQFSKAQKMQKREARLQKIMPNLLKRVAEDRKQFQQDPPSETDDDIPRFDA